MHHNAVQVWVFGSVARRADSRDSDLDLLVRFAPGASTFDLVALEDDLTSLMGIRVDTVIGAGLTDRHDAIRRDATGSN